MEVYQISTLYMVSVKKTEYPTIKSVSTVYNVDQQMNYYTTASDIANITNQCLFVSLSCNSNIFLNIFILPMPTYHCQKFIY